MAADDPPDSEERLRLLVESVRGDDFLASVSHELRTPLTAILGWTRLLAHPALDEAKRTRGLATIERNAHAMAQLIDELIDISRIVTGTLRLDKKAVELPDVIDTALTSVGAAADAKWIHIERDVALDAGPVHGDAARLRQVVSKLVRNAVILTPPAGHMTVRLHTYGEQAQIVVEDGGTGIEPDVLPHVFEAFRPGDASLTRTTGGLDLGLAIVRHLVELHGGRVEARSLGPGRGARFTVLLPMLSRPE